MKAVRRKAAALLLAVTMLFGLAPAAALAEDPAPQRPVFDSDLSTDPVTYYQNATGVPSLSVSASVQDSGTLSYQWYGAKESGDVAGDPDNAIGGAESSSYQPPVKDSGTTCYQVTVTNTLDGQTATAESAVAEVIVLDPSVTPQLTVEVQAEDGSDPAKGYTYNVGDQATALKAVAGADIPGGTWNYIWWADYGSFWSGVGSDSTYTPATYRGGMLAYFCEAQYKLGGKTFEIETDEVSVAVIATSAAVPTIYDQPAGCTYQTNALHIIALSVDAWSSDGGTLSYQWEKSADDTNFSPIDGATAESYMPPTSSVEATCYYRCVITNTVTNVNKETYTASATSDSVAVKFESVPANSWGGEGTAGSPFLMRTAADLEQLEKFVNEQGLPFDGFYFKLDDDITLPPGWVPIGAKKPGASSTGSGTNIWPFSGTIDGGGHTLTVPEGGLPLLGYVRFATVKNLSIYGKQIAGYGLVNNYSVDYGPTGSYSDWTASAIYPDMPLTVEIDNVTLKSGSQTLQSGFLGGYASGANTVRINNSTVESGVTIGYDGTKSEIGSFAGWFNGTMENCVSYATVKGKNDVGGLIGAKGQSMGNCSIWDSVFHGAVEASGTYAGGIIGSGYSADSAPNTPCVTIQNCYADGSVAGADYVGGLFGGEPSCKQNWADGIGYIQNNYFSGTVSAGANVSANSTNSTLKSGAKVFATEETDAGGAHVGGIIGSMKSLDRYNVISNNYYLETCGAGAGIGSVDSVTKMPASQNAAASPQSTNTAAIRQSAKELAAQPTTSNSQYGRSDDPTGADACKLAEPATEEQFTDGSVLSKLNGGVNSSGTWVKGGNGCPAMDNGKKHMTSLTVSGASGYASLRYPGGSSLDDLSVFAAYSDGTTEPVPQSGVHFSGFNSNTAGYKTVTAKYQNHASLFEVYITTDADTPSSSPVTVSFRLIGATKSNGPVNLKQGDYKGSQYVTWIPTTSYTLPANSTVSDLLKEALGDTGMTAAGADSDYISAVYAPKVCGGYKLAADTNGPRSGWMYTIGGSHSVESIKDQPLENGDAVIFHYVDDYSYEVADWFSSPDYPRLGDGTYYDEWLTADDTGPTAPEESSQQGQSQTAAAAQSTVTTMPAPNGGTISTVTTRPDAAPEVVGGKSTISVTMPPDVASILAAATAEKPAEIRINAPASDMIAQIGSSAVKAVTLNMKVPSAVASGANANIKISIRMDASVLQAAKEQNKDVTVLVTDADTGRESYSWTFTGAGLAGSAAAVTNVDLALSVGAASEDPAASGVTAANTADQKAAGAVLKFADNGLLPAPASVRAYVGGQPGCAPGSKVYLYYLDGALKSLVQMPASERSVDANGYVAVTVSHCSEYVLLPQAASNPYPVKSDTTYTLSVKSGRSYTYAMTVSGGAAPSFAVGNGQAFATSVKRSKNKYYFTVKAIGKAGMTTAVYSILPGQKPAALCYLAVA